MAKQSSVNLDITNNPDGFDISGGTVLRKLGITGGDITVAGSGNATLTFPTTTTTIAGIGITQSFTVLQTFNAGLSASGATFSGNIFAPNIVTSFNGLTGAVAGVASVNGSTGAVITYVGTTGNIPYRYGTGVGITANSYFTLQSGDIGDPTDILLLYGVTGTETWRGNAEAVGLEFHRGYSGLGLDEGGGAAIVARGIYNDGGYLYGSNLRLTTPWPLDEGGKIILAPQGSGVVTVTSSSVSVDVPFESLIVGTEGLGRISSDSIALGTTAANQTIAIVSYSTYRSVEFFVQASTAGGAYEALRITALHDGSSTWNTQYGVIRSGASLGTYSTILHGPGLQLRLRVTPTTVDTTYKVMITALPV